MPQERISVIIPVYKVEDYLQTCVDSVLSQTYPALEIILVDDGSPDTCPAICDAYAAADARVRVVHKANGGLSSARNAGLDVAQGDYIAYVDSDDYIAPDMLETLLQTAKTYNADLVKCNYVQFTQGEPIPSCADDTNEVRTFTAEEAVLSFLSDPFSRRKPFQTIVWNALYRADAIRSLRFPEGLLYEDGYYSPQAFLSCETLAHIDRTFYYYRINPSSIMGSGITQKALKSIDDWEFIYNTIRSRFPSAAELAVPRWIRKLLSTYDYLIRQDAIDTDGACRAHIVEKIRANRDLFLQFADAQQKKCIRMLCRDVQRYNRSVCHPSALRKLSARIRSVLR